MSLPQKPRVRTKAALLRVGQPRGRRLRLEPLEDRRLLAFTVNHTPYIQLGNAPLTGFGSGLDQAEIIWQTTGTQDTDTFTAQVRETGTVPWTNVPLNAQIVTGVGGRINHSSTFVGLNFSDDYDYLITHLRGGSPIATHQSTFHTRLNSNDQSNFTLFVPGACYCLSSCFNQIGGTSRRFAKGPGSAASQRQARQGREALSRRPQRSRCLVRG